MVVGSTLPSTDLAVARLDDPVVSRGVREKIVLLPREVLPGVGVVFGLVIVKTTRVGLSMVGVVTGRSASGRAKKEHGLVSYLISNLDGELFIFIRWTHPAALASERRQSDNSRVREYMRHPRRSLTAKYHD